MVLDGGNARVKFSIIHPTARVTPAFEHVWWKAAIAAVEHCDNPAECEYILVVHETRVIDFYRYLKEYWPLKWGRFTVVTNHGRDCLVDQCNAAGLAAQGEIIVGNQDDMRFPEHWDSEILKLIPDTSKMVCVKAKTDGAPRPDLLTIPTIATKVLCDAIGPLSPEYDGMYSDNDWSASVFASEARVIHSFYLYFQHLHPANANGKADAVHLMENREEAYRIGKEVFERRKAAGFPRVELPGYERKDIAQTTRRIIAICTPGEKHSWEWEKEYMRLVFGLAFKRWVVRSNWGYSTNVYQTRAGLTRDVLKDAETTGAAPDLVLWIDDDNTPSLEAVEMLIDTLEAHREFDGAAGWCWIKFRDAEGKIVFMPSVGNFKPGTMYLLSTKLDDLYADEAAPKSIEWSGFPTLLMRFDALKQLGPLSFAPLPCKENENGFTGEDVSFFCKARSAGLKFCVDPRAKVDHVKPCAIEPDYVIGKKADPVKAQNVENDRARRNGAEMEVSPEVAPYVYPWAEEPDDSDERTDLMEAAM
jgi:hypothetical protein